MLVMIVQMHCNMESFCPLSSLLIFNAGNFTIAGRFAGRSTSTRIWAQGTVPVPGYVVCSCAWTPQVMVFWVLGVLRV